MICVSAICRALIPQSVFHVSNGCDNGCLDNKRKKIRPFVSTLSCCVQEFDIYCILFLLLFDCCKIQDEMTQFYDMAARLWVKAAIG